MVMIVIMIIMIITHYLQAWFSWPLLFMFLLKGSRVQKGKNSNSQKWLVS